jgi:hypothetical protein
MDGWVAGKAGIRIAYSNQKLFLFHYSWNPQFFDLIQNRSKLNPSQSGHTLPFESQTIPVLG